MSQFDVHRNQNSVTKARFPLLLDVQSDLLEPLATRVVIPLAPAAATRRQRIESLTPKVVVDRKEYLVMTPLLAGIATRDLGPSSGNLASDRAAILAALDLLITGF